MSSRVYAVILLVLGLLGALPGAEGGTVTPAEGPSFSVVAENDNFSFFGDDDQDRHYTQGLKLIWLGADQPFADLTTPLDRAIPAWGFQPTTSQSGWVVIGQNIYTPEDLLATELIPDDRPYAGWLYSGLVFVRRGSTTRPGIEVLESFEGQLGIIGPASLAEPAQSTIHRWFRRDRIPEGWDNQLNTEPGLLLKYGRAWRLRAAGMETEPWMDVIPHAGIALGNVQVLAGAGATLRLGWNLPDDFGPQIIDSLVAVHGRGRATTKSWGFHLFGRFEGRAVAWNTFLDGNTFSSSHHVAKEPLVADLAWGMVAQITHYLEISYTRVMRTGEFVKQDGRDYFGSLLFKIKYDF